MITTSEKKPVQPFMPGETLLAGSLGEGYPRQPSHDEISRSAYDIYVASGCKQGQCTKNWFQAEQSLRSFAPAVQPVPVQSSGTFAPSAGGRR